MFKYIKTLFDPPTKEQLEEKLVGLREDECVLRQILKPNAEVPWRVLDEFREVRIEIATIEYKLSKM